MLAQPLKMIRFNGGRAAEPEPAASDQVDREGEEDDVAVRPERGRDGDGPDQGGDVVALERPAQGGTARVGGEMIGWRTSGRGCRTNRRETSSGSD